MHAVVHDDPPRLREIRPDLPADIEAIVSRALQKDPARRYQSAAEMVNDLSAALAALEAPPARWLASGLCDSGGGPDSAGGRGIGLVLSALRETPLGARAGDPGNRQADESE